MRVILVLVIVLAIIFSFIIGYKYAIHKKAKEMIEEMMIGSIIIDMTGVDKELFTCQFDKNPKEILNKDYIIMEVKIRR